MNYFIGLVIALLCGLAVWQIVRLVVDIAKKIKTRRARSSAQSEKVDDDANKI